MLTMEGQFYTDVMSTLQRIRAPKPGKKGLKFCKKGISFYS